MRSVVVILLGYMLVLPHVDVTSVTLPPADNDTTSSDTDESNVMLRSSNNDDERNLALGKPAFQSSRSHHGAADRAVDGNMNDTYTDGSCTHTRNEKTDSPWLVVDLLDLYEVTHVKIKNRMDCCSERLANFRIMIGNEFESGKTQAADIRTWSECAYVPGKLSAGELRDIKCSNVHKGRFVAVHLVQPGVLTVCELQVYDDIPKPEPTTPPTPKPTAAPTCKPLPAPAPKLTAAPTPMPRAAPIPEPKELPDAFHYLPMDEIVDNKILGTINGTMVNSPRLVEGMIGKALHFNGNSQSVELGYSACFSDLEQCGSNGYSTAMWLKLDNLQHARYMLSSGGQTGQSRAGGIAVVTKDGKLKVEIRSYKARKAWISPGLTVSPNEWVHLAAIWDGSVMKVYQNGELQQIAQASTPHSQHWAVTPVESKMFIGRPNNGDQPQFKGKFTIDEWYYWNNLLSEKDIHSLYMIKNFVEH